MVDRLYHREPTHVGSASTNNNVRHETEQSDDEHQAIDPSLKMSARNEPLPCSSTSTSHPIIHQTRTWTTDQPSDGNQPSQANQEPSKTNQAKPSSPTRSHECTSPFTDRPQSQALSPRKHLVTNPNTSLQSSGSERGQASMFQHLAARTSL
jgi:hypothetical protein